MASQDATRLPNRAVQRIPLFTDVVLRFEETAPERKDGDFIVRWETQVARQSIELPNFVMSEDAARTLLTTADGRTPGLRAIVRLEPIRRPVPNGPLQLDRWTRLGALTVAPIGPDALEAKETELIRFTTGYGAGGTYEADVTALAPLLSGRRLMRLSVATYGDHPGWRASAELIVDPAATGRRDPLIAMPLFDDLHYDAEQMPLRTEVTVPAGASSPRIRIVTSGHSTDGTGANEFATATHILRVDGREVARWRPWRDGDPSLRERNPWAGTLVVNGKTLRASDLDRSGWAPGAAVEPMIIPLPELTPGLHRIDLRILGIRKAEPDSTGHGYFAVTATLLADKQWSGDDE
ncbi:MAG: peptide-N-glycosidase F-related protein [Phycisphaerales bacterium]